MSNGTTELPAPLLQALKACRTLPSVPVVVLQVLDLCQDEDVGVVSVAKVIARDPALAGKVLKVANSPWYGVRSEITTLDRAVTLLGVNATLSLALSFSLVRGLSKSAEERFDHQAYWRRSVIAAAATRVVGSAAKTASPDELFLAGLLQDIGMLVLSEAVPKLYGPLVAASQGDHQRLAMSERAEFGADHADIGNWLLAKWNLPTNLREAVAGSHDFSGIKKHGPLARSVAAGSLIAEIWANPNTAASTTFAQEAARSLLDINRERFEQLLNEIAVSLPEATANLDVDVGGEEFINRVLDQARASLVELNLQAQIHAQQIQIQAQRDQLTSLFNRAYLNDVLPRQFEIAIQMAQPMTVIFIDIDNFKVINDTHGHHGGDAVLISVARVIQTATRNFDTVVRFGGDEFVVLLANSNEQVGEMVSERIRASVEAKPHDLGEDVRIPVTVSAGCATMSSTTRFTNAKELLEVADRCLYAAKSGGRNRVVTYEPLSS